MFRYAYGATDRRLTGRDHRLLAHLGGCAFTAAVFAPMSRCHQQQISRFSDAVRMVYGVDSLDELEVDFVEGNHPHYLFRMPDRLPDLVLGD